MKQKMRDKRQVVCVLKWTLTTLGLGMRSSAANQLSAVLQLILIVLVSVPISYSTSALVSSSESAEEPVYTRIRRQIFRQTIPADRPLTGNIYAEHHGYPHPGRWHERPQSIKPPNPNSGHHFENQNVILTDDDFNRYGSTLQHIDEMIYQQRLREQPHLVHPPQQQQYHEPPQQLQLDFVQNIPPTQHQQPHGQIQITGDYGPPPSAPAPPPPPPSVSYGPVSNHIQYLPAAPQYSPPPPPAPTQGHHAPFQPSYFPPPPHPHQQQHPPQHNFLANHPGIEHGQIHIVSDNNVNHGPVPPSAAYGSPPPAPETEIVHHGNPNPVIPVVAHFHYNHQLGEVKGERTVKYLPGAHFTHGHGQSGPDRPEYGSPSPPPSIQYGPPPPPAPKPSQGYGADLRPQYGAPAPKPSPQYGAELHLPQYNVLGPEDDIHSSGPGPSFYGPSPVPVHSPKPVKIKHQHHHHHHLHPDTPPPPSFHRLKAPLSYSIRRPKHFSTHSNSNNYGGYLPIGNPARRPVRYSLRTPGSYSWSVSY